MTNNKYEIDIGFIITKAPYESSLDMNILNLVGKSQEEGKSIGIFLISDGVWLAKNNNNETGILLKTIINKGAKVMVSQDNLIAAGINNTEILKDIDISDNPYTDLVIQVMEKWGRVITI